jgi:hypothetical protein
MKAPRFFSVVLTRKKKKASQHHEHRDALAIARGGSKVAFAGMSVRQDADHFSAAPRCLYLALNRSFGGDITNYFVRVKKLLFRCIYT